MNYLWKYKTPEGFDDLWMSCEDDVLTGLWFDESKDAAKHVPAEEERLTPIFEETIRWLDIYFGSSVPDFTPAYRIKNLTDFRGEAEAVR